MDKAKVIACVKGLIMEMDNQVYQTKQRGLEPLIEQEAIKVIINGFYKAIKDFLNKEDENATA